MFLDSHTIPSTKIFPIHSARLQNTTGGFRLLLCFFARLMGADPTTSRVTGECSTVELQPQNMYEQYTISLYFSIGTFARVQIKCAGGGIRTHDLNFMSVVLLTN